ncbi:MAG TPA: hypothetical protein DHV85_17625, partial [Candidatus Accumulibacter sp.]|nr:hypothetical protein [Accumulibacter sp.]
MLRFATQGSLLQITNPGLGGRQLAAQGGLALGGLIGFSAMTVFKFPQTTHRSLIGRFPVPRIPSELDVRLFGQRHQHLRKWCALRIPHQY